MFAFAARCSRIALIMGEVGCHQTYIGSLFVFLTYQGKGVITGQLGAFDGKNYDTNQLAGLGTWEMGTMASTVCLFLSFHVMRIVVVL